MFESCPDERHRAPLNGGNDEREDDVTQTLNFLVHVPRINGRKPPNAEDQCSFRGMRTSEWARIKFPISDHVMPAQAGTQFFGIRCEIRWVPACAGMTETNYP
jgi:hypothetical protein